MDDPFALEPLAVDVTEESEAAERLCCTTAAVSQLMDATADPCRRLVQLEASEGATDQG